MGTEYYVKAGIVVIVGGFICFFMFDMGKWSLEKEIKNYGCEKVMSIRQGK